MALTGALALYGASLAGCGAKPETPTQTLPAPTPRVAPAQRSQDRSRVVQAIQGMTSEQRAAYFKAHPEDAALLAP